MNHYQMLSKLDALQISDFAQEMRVLRAQTLNDFGRAELPRNTTDFIADTVVGKSAEVLFRHFAYQFGITLDVDFNIYDDQHVTDNGQDVPLVELSHRGFPGWWANNIKIDVKATAKISKWLLVEERKFISNAYVLIRMDIPNNWENLEIDLNGMSGEISGFAWWTDILDLVDNLPWFPFSEGQSLFHADALEKDNFETALELHEYLRNNPQRNMNMTLRSKSNLGLPIHWLRNSEDAWKDLFNTIATGATRV